MPTAEKKHPPHRKKTPELQMELIYLQFNNMRGKNFK
jgi:hypothetical protein